MVAAGSGSRFGGEIPKQFLDLGGRSIVERSVRALAGRAAVDRVVLVLSADEASSPRAELARTWPGVEVVAGGATRSESAFRGVSAASGTPYVLVHDAARPLASARLIDAVIDGTRRHGAAVPVVEIADTVKSVEGDRVKGTLPRETLRLAQTPQGARRDWLLAALERARRSGEALNDEAAALELDGHPPHAVPGDPANRKITTPADLDDARRRWAAPESSLRVGTGFDVHRLDPDRPLVLGGVDFPGEPGLSGHSDADVVLHAAMDAVLGALGLGDIGSHFPPDDERWAGADSRDLARRIGGLVREQGASIVNVDVTVLAEAPKIGPRVGALRRSIAECLGTEPSRIGVKATTLERMGALGRREGIGCQAVALVATGIAAAE